MEHGRDHRLTTRKRLSLEAPWCVWQQERQEACVPDGSHPPGLSLKERTPVFIEERADMNKAVLSSFILPTRTYPGALFSADSDSGSGLRFCISSKLSGDANAACLWTTF